MLTKVKVVVTEYYEGDGPGDCTGHQADLIRVREHEYGPEQWRKVQADALLGRMVQNMRQGMQLELWPCNWVLRNINAPGSDYLFLGDTAAEALTAGGVSDV